MYTQGKIFNNKCIECNNTIHHSVVFDKDPLFLCFYFGKNNFSLNDLIKYEKQTITVNNKSFKFLFGIIYTPGHFIGIFNISNRFYRVNDLILKNEKQVSEIYPDKNNNIFETNLNSCFYSILNNCNHNWLILMIF